MPRPGTAKVNSGPSSLPQSIMFTDLQCRVLFAGSFLGNAYKTQPIGGRALSVVPLIVWQSASWLEDIVSQTFKFSLYYNYAPYTWAFISFHWESKSFLIKRWRRGGGGKSAWRLILFALSPSLCAPFCFSFFLSPLFFKAFLWVFQSPWLCSSSLIESVAYPA